MSNIKPRLQDGNKYPVTRKLTQAQPRHLTRAEKIRNIRTFA